MRSRIIIHADMDAFYAAVEQLDNPQLRGKPVLVGPRSYRGVVLTASYEARPYGVGSAMPVARARKLCPDAVMVPPRFERYQEVSAAVMEVFANFSPKVEAISLDEAFLDMSGAEHIFGPPVEMGRQLKAAVFEKTQLNISVGVSGTKYVAKVASAHDKPNGLTVVPQEEAVQWLAPLPIERLWGVGPVTAKKLHGLGLHTIGAIAALDEQALKGDLGAAARHFHKLANAIDPRTVHRDRARSIGSDRTLSQNVSTPAEIEPHLRRSAHRIARRLRAKNYVANGIRVRLKTSHHEMLTRQAQLPKPTDVAATLYTNARQLLDAFEHPGPFRLVGMAVFDLHANVRRQLDLFEDYGNRELEVVIDKLAERFGKDTIVRANDLSQSGPGSRAIHADGMNLDFLDHSE